MPTVIIGARARMAPLQGMGARDPGQRQSPRVQPSETGLTYLINLAVMTQTPHIAPF